MPPKSPANPLPADLPIIGWREWVSLPDLKVPKIKAKVDTGARTSALHAFRLKVRSVPGGEVATFEVHPTQNSRVGTVKVQVPITGWKEVRSSNGETQRRPVIRTKVKVGNRSWPIDITLTNRDEMGFRMLLGRSAVRRRYLVDAGQSFVYPAALSPNRSTSSKKKPSNSSPVKKS